MRFQLPWIIGSPVVASRNDSRTGQLYDAVHYGLVETLRREKDYIAATRRLPAVRANLKQI
jgi:hypothetical protein